MNLRASDGHDSNGPGYIAACFAVIVAFLPTMMGYMSFSFGGGEIYTWSLVLCGPAVVLACIFRKAGCAFLWVLATVAWVGAVHDRFSWLMPLMVSGAAGIMQFGPKLSFSALRATR